MTEEEVQQLLNEGETAIYSQPGQALQIANKALKQAVKHNYPHTIARCYRQLSVVAYSQGDYVKATENCYVALSIADGLKDEKFKATIYNQLGLINGEKKEYAAALEKYIQALNIIRGLNDIAIEAVLLNNIGLVHNQQQQWAPAREYFLQSISLGEQLNNLRIQAYGYNNLALAHWNLAEREQALECLQTGLQLALEIDDKNIQSELYCIMAEFKSQQNNFEQAVVFFKKAQQLAMENNFPFKLKQVYEGLSLNYERMGDFAKALEQHKNLMAVQFDILNQDKNTAMARSELRFEMERKETVLRAEVAETETRALRAQMNPHFIFNSLNSINDYIQKNDLESAGYFIGGFARLMRMILENSEKKEVSLADDLSALQLYMQLEARRLQGKFTFDIIVDETVDAENTLVPPLLLQPFIENSIWHGLAQKQGTGKITVRIAENNGLLYCIVEDDGIGREAAAQMQQPRGEKSLGMKITRARIDLLNRINDMQAAISFTDLVQGLRVEIKLPLELNF